MSRFGKVMSNQLNSVSLSPTPLTLVGFSDGIWAEYMKRRTLVKKWRNQAIPELQPPKSFKQKHDEIPILDNYEGTLSEDYWSCWTKRSFESITPGKSWVCPDKLEVLANTLGLRNRGRLDRVLDRLRNGATLGCKGAARLPTKMPNGPSVAECGVRLADSLQDWIKDGIAWGPLLPEEMPWRDYTVNPMQVRLKPNGKARIIINMSSPYPKEKDSQETPASVNSGIDKSEFPTSMSSTESFLCSLMRAGCPAQMSKLDWVSAYKHQHVHPEDLKLQVFEFWGRLFGELMLVFGAVSSAGIYDDLAKLILDLALIHSKMDERMVNQVLDDVVACGTEGDCTVQHFYNAYREVAARVGVLLADESDVDKAFGATHTGKVLGITYNLQSWTGWITDDKLSPLLNMLGTIVASEVVSNGLMLSLNGKLNHYMWLVPGGAWQRGFLLQMQDAGQSHGTEFCVTDLARVQAEWWIINLRVATEYFPLPDPRPMSRMGVKKVFSDAAGGTEAKIANGVGGVCYPSMWFYMPWPDTVRKNLCNSLGVRFANKLSCLEGFGSLVGLVIVPDIARNSEVELINDNAGFVYAFRKKHSSCPYAYTVAKAIQDVATGLNCKVTVTKTMRCSGNGEQAADALSKGDWVRAKNFVPHKNDAPEFIPRTLLRWIRDPVPDMELGSKVLSEMSSYTKVLHMD